MTDAERRLRDKLNALEMFNAAQYTTASFGVDDVRSVLDDLTALRREVERLTRELAECYRLTGADPDGNEDWRLAKEAVIAVRELRHDYDATGLALDTLRQEHASLHDLYTTQARELREALKNRDECAAVFEIDRRHELTGPVIECGCPSCFLHHRYQTQLKAAEQREATLRERLKRLIAHGQEQMKLAHDMMWVAGCAYVLVDLAALVAELPRDNSNPVPISRAAFEKVDELLTPVPAAEQKE